MHIFPGGLNPIAISVIGLVVPDEKINHVLVILFVLVVSECDRHGVCRLMDWSVMDSVARLKNPGRPKFLERNQIAGAIHPGLVG